MSAMHPRRVAASLFLGLAACVGLPTAPPAGDSGTAGSTSQGLTSTTTAATVVSSDAETQATTLALDEGELSTTSNTSSESGSSSSSATSSDGTTTTGEPPDCHPLLVEIFYDTQAAEDMEQWIKLYNACDEDVDLGFYSLGWGGADYTFGTLDLTGSLAMGDCFIVGGPMSISDNAFPTLDQSEDFDPDLQKSGGYADGVALFLGMAAGIQLDTIPVDAVIYGGENFYGLLDANGDSPAPHVGDAGDTDSIRRTSEMPPTWIIESSPMPDLCPPF